MQHKCESLGAGKREVSNTWGQGHVRARTDRSGRLHKRTSSRAIVGEIDEM